MKAEAPGKLILSGEHSVVYGGPALAVALARKVSVVFTPDASQEIKIYSDQLGQFSFSLEQLPQFTEQLDQNFSAFLNHKLPISDVLSSPFDLLIYVLLQQASNVSGTLQITSDIPAGAGMGSSAAVICALLKLSQQISGRGLSIEELCRKVRYCERLQHGRGSAIDAAAVTYAGTVKVLGDSVTKLPAVLDSNWYLWNSGSPLSSTGETVAYVRESFEGSPIWQEFTQVTTELEGALCAQDTSKIKRLVRANKKLLERIGVVPDVVSTAIHHIEALGGAAKICGAGSAAGDAGGIVLVYLPETPPSKIEAELNIKLEPVLLA
ncbi:MAG: mevalonate kinase [Neptuniibacter sp.]